MSDEILTKKELAELLKVTEKTIDNLRKKGLPCFKVGNNIRFDKNKVLEWLQKGGLNE